MVVDEHSKAIWTRQERLRLLARIQRRYAVLTEQIQTGPFQVQFTRIADPEVVLEEAAREEDRLEKTSGIRKESRELHLPYWAELWDSALGLSTFLAEQWAHCGRGESAVARLARQASLGERPSSIRVLDLGCGMGLTGTVAAKLGTSVLFADLEAPALLFARLNSLPFGRRCRSRRLNWETDRLEEGFDLILGADIVYDRIQWTALEVFLQAHLAPGGAVLIGEPGRSSGTEFEPWAIARGWKITHFVQELPARNKPIRLMELRR